jgi:hypothetical protein
VEFVKWLAKSTDARSGVVVVRKIREVKSRLHVTRRKHISLIDGVVFYGKEGRLVYAAHSDCNF